MMMELLELTSKVPGSGAFTGSIRDDIGDVFRLLDVLVGAGTIVGLSGFAFVRATEGRMSAFWVMMGMNLLLVSSIVTEITVLGQVVTYRLFTNTIGTLMGAYGVKRWIDEVRRGITGPNAPQGQEILSDGVMLVAERYRDKIRHEEATRQEHGLEHEPLEHEQ